MWCLRPDERPRTPVATRTAGVRVVFPDGVTHFFPGASPELALALARPCAGALLDAPGTAIDFGESSGRSKFVVTRPIKVPVKKEGG